MRALPTILYPNHDELSQAMFFDDSMAYGLPEGNAIFYSIRDGNWNDRSIWETVGNSGVNGLPSASDVVYVRHSVKVDAPSSIINVSIKHLFVSGILTADAATVSNAFNILGNIQCVGTIDFTGSNIVLNLFGTNNYIANFTKGSSSIVYSNVKDQPLMPVNYNIIQVLPFGVKYATGNLVADTIYIGVNAANNITDSVILDLGSNSLVAGSINISSKSSGGTRGQLKKSVPGGSVLITGSLFLGNSTSGTAIDFTGSNTDVELQGGISATNYTPNTLKSGTGLWKFTTNNQLWTCTTLSGGQGFTIDAPILISGAISLKLEGGNFYAALFKGIIDGDNAASTLINAKNYNPGTNYQATTQPMATGILDCSSFANVWKYNKAGNQEIKGTTYDTLELGGSGVKKLMGNVTVLTAYSLTGTATVDLNGYTLTTP